MLGEQGHELGVGDAAAIRAARVRRQKTDSRDAIHILDLLLTDRFPRIGVPSPKERDTRQLIRQRHKRVCFRTSVLRSRPQRQGSARNGPTNAVGPPWALLPAQIIARVS